MKKKTDNNQEEIKDTVEDSASVKEKTSADSEQSSAEKKTERKKKLGPNLDFASTEAYNLLRTNVMFSFPEGPGSKIVGITSACPQEGKSFTCANLAYSTAEAGYKVIVVDCDLRRPSVYKNLDLPLSPGLTNYLVNDVRDVIHSGVLHENLNVITAGDIPPNPSELLGSDRMRDTLELLRSRFDYIFLDLPPVLSVSDPLVISKYLDGIIVVTKHNTTRRSDLTETVRQLTFTNVHILGFVYNSFGNNSSGYYRSKYYRSGYYKGYYKRHYYSSYTSDKPASESEKG